MAEQVTGETLGKDMPEGTRVVLEHGPDAESVKAAYVLFPDGSRFYMPPENWGTPCLGSFPPPPGDKL